MSNWAHLNILMTFLLVRNLKKVENNLRMKGLVACRLKQLIWNSLGPLDPLTMIYYMIYES